MVTKEKMDELKRRFANEKERDAVREEIKRLCDEDLQSVCEIAKLQMEETHEKIDDYIVRKQIEDILPGISIAYIAKKYFNKSRGWLHQRISGSIVNGVPAKFTPEEKEKFNQALHDMGKRLMSTSIS